MFKNYALGWIDKSQKDRKMSLDLIHSNMEEGAVDELRLGVVRDAFADYFFPGTSTIQTRAKYFLLVPCLIYAKIEKSQTKKSNDELKNNYLNEEKEISKKIFDCTENKDSIGLIGIDLLKSEDNGWVVRTIVTIYWNGLREYGLLKNKNKYSFPKFIAYCNKQKNKDDLSISKNTNDGYEGFKNREEINNFGVTPEINKLYPKGISSIPLTLDLNKQEALLLRNKIIECSRPCLFKDILQYNISLLDLKDLNKGERFSAFYDMMMSNPNISEADKEVLKSANEFRKLGQLLEEAFNACLYDNDISTKLNGFKINADLINFIYFKFPKLDKAVKDFLDNCISLINGNETNKQKLLMECIEDRESKMKGGGPRCKLKNKEYYKQRKFKANFDYDFRLGIASQIVTDIQEGLKR